MSDDTQRQKAVDRQVQLANMRTTQARREAKAAVEKTTKEDSGRPLPEWKWAR
jgi:hypothetical protein